MEKRIIFSLCPVLSASYIAKEKGFLAQQMAAAEYSVTDIMSLEPSVWEAHFTLDNDRLFRHSGSVPPILAQASGTETVLLGISVIRERSPFVVRADSPIVDPSQLRGRRVALPVQTGAIADVRQANARQQTLALLSRWGLTEEDIRWVNIENPNGIYREGRGAVKASLDIFEAEALEAEQVDLIFGKFPRTEQMVAAGHWRYLENGTVEYPALLTVSRTLAHEEPEAVKAYLAAVAQAADWAEAEPAEANRLLAKQSGGSEEAFNHAFGADSPWRLRPCFAAEEIRVLSEQIEFLYKYGFIKQMVDIKQWASPII